MPGEIFAGSIETKAQADGAQTIALENADKFREHQIQLEVSATPAVGSLDVSVRTPGAAAFVSVGTIDMTDSSEYLQQIKGYATELKFTPTGFDAGKTYSVFVVSGAGV